MRLAASILEIDYQLTVKTSAQSTGLREIESRSVFVESLASVCAGVGGPAATVAPGLEFVAAAD